MHVTKELQDVPSEMEVKIKSIEDRYINVITRQGKNYRLALTKTLQHLDADEVYYLMKIEYKSNQSRRMIDAMKGFNVFKATKV